MACKCISVPFLVWLMIVTGLLLAYNCVHGQGPPQSTLVSDPINLAEGTLCPTARILMTCSFENLDNLFWFSNGNNTYARYSYTPGDTYPRPLPPPSPDGLTFLINNITAIEGPHFFTLSGVSTLNTTALSLYDSRSRIIDCGTEHVRSPSISINFTIKESPTLSPPSCSISPIPLSDGGVNVSLKLSSSEKVGRYEVVVDPDPFSCSSDNVTADEFHCSVNSTQQIQLYLFQTRAIDYCNQESEVENITIDPQLSAPEPPQNVEVVMISNTSGLFLSVKWRESAAISGRCLFSGAIHYTVTLEDTAASIVEERIVSSESESCNNGNCSIIIISTFRQICGFNVHVVAANEFGSSNMTTTVNVDAKLTSINLALLSIGVVLHIVTIIEITVALIWILATSSFCDIISALNWLLLSLLILLPLVLWVAVGFHVGLQDKHNTCDEAWQDVRNDLIISSFAISVVVAVVAVVVVVAIIAVPYYKKRQASASEDEAMGHQAPSMCCSSTAPIAVSEASVVILGTIVNEFKERGEEYVSGRLRVQERNYRAQKSTQSAVSTWLPGQWKWSKEDLSKGRPLKVDFTNCPRWKYDKSLITPELIMKFLDETWKGCFTVGCKDDSYIRVSFQNDTMVNGSWSVVGSIAKTVPKSDPTMVLNFSSMNDEQIKGTIVHQFGHALGLGHALMRPEDWEVLKEYLDLQQMLSFYSSPSLEDFEVQWTGKGRRDPASVNYDEESIMTFSVNLLWLKDHTLSTYEGIQSASEVPNVVKECLRKFIEHAKLRNKLSANDERVLRTILEDFGLEEVLTLQDGDFDLANAAASSWKKIGRNLGIGEKDMKTAKRKFQGAERIKWVLGKWFNQPDDLANKDSYPLSWEGLRKLLVDSGLQSTADQYLTFLDSLNAH